MTGGSVTAVTAVTVLAALAVVVAGAAGRPIRRRTPDRTRPGDGNGASFRLAEPIERARARRRRRGDPGADEVAAWCDELASDLRGGSTLRHALTTVIPSDEVTATRTEPLRLALARARPIEDATAMARGPGPHLHLALAVIAATSEVSGSAAAIDRVAATLRQRAADRAERRVQAAQARLSAHVMTAVPLSMLGLLLATDGDVRAVMTTPVGATCLVTGLALNASGWMWMRHIVEGST